MEEFLLGAAGEVHRQADEFDFFWNQSIEIQLLPGLGAVGRSHGADEVFFFSHGGLLENGRR